MKSPGEDSAYCCCSYYLIVMVLFNNDNNIEQIFELNNPSKCLILKPEDWHTMYDFSEDAILMVFASEYFDKNDYIFEPYI